MSKELAKGTKLNNRYEIEKVLGRGGFGTTYKAMDTLVDVPVAIKEYEINRLKDRELAQREVKMAARFYDLQGIASARDFFVQDNVSYIVMEYVEGISVKKYVSEYGSFKGPEILQKLKPVLLSLCTIHREGVIHRDISPDNMMITKRGTMKLIDFGEARQLVEQKNRALTLVYKRGYAPIEQCRQQGEQGAYTDIYSLCASIYFAVTGIIPDDAVERLIVDHLKPLSQIHGTGLAKYQAEAIMKGLEIFPENRFQTVEELYEQLYEETPDIGEMEGLGEEEYYTQRKKFSTAHVLDEIDEFYQNKKDRKKAKYIGIVLIVIICVVLIVGIMVFWRNQESVPDIPREPQVAEETRTPVPTTKYEIGRYIDMKKGTAKEKLEPLVKEGLKVQFKEKYSKKKKGIIIYQSMKEGEPYEDLSGLTLILTVSKGEKPNPTATPKPKSEDTKKENVNFDGDLDELS